MIDILLSLSLITAWACIWSQGRRIKELKSDVAGLYVQLYPSHPHCRCVIKPIVDEEE